VFGLDAQVLGQGAAAGLVLGQGRAALPAQGQEPHELALALLAPGVQLHLTPGMGQGAGELAAALVGGGQAVQGVEDLAVQLLAAGGDPVLKRGAIFDGQALQKGAAV